MTKLSIGDIPRITRRVDWSELDERLTEGYIDVWVNPDGAFWELYLQFNETAGEHKQAVEEYQRTPEGSEHDHDAAQKVVSLGMGKIQLIHQVYAMLWDVDVDAVRQIASDPQLSGIYAWCCDRTWQEIEAFRNNRKNA